MAHSNLKGHRKLRDLCRELNISEQLAVGLLQYLWWEIQEKHAVDPDGLLAEWSDKTVASSAGWTGDVERFGQALRNAGFLEPNTHEVIVHDWADWAPRFVTRRWEKRGWSKGHNGKWFKEGGLRQKQSKRGAPGCTQGNPRAPPGAPGHLTQRNPTRPDGTQDINSGAVELPVDASARGEQSKLPTRPGFMLEEFTGPDRKARAQRDKFRSLFAAKVCIALGLNGTAAQQQKRSLYAVARRIEGRADDEALAHQFVAIAVEKRDAGLDKPIAAWQKAVDEVLGKSTKVREE